MIFLFIIQIIYNIHKIGFHYIIQNIKIVEKTFIYNLHVFFFKLTLNYGTRIFMLCLQSFVFTV